MYVKEKVPFFLNSF